MIGCHVNGAVDTGFICLATGIGNTTEMFFFWAIVSCLFAATASAHSSGGNKRPALHFYFDFYPNRLTIWPHSVSGPRKESPRATVGSVSWPDNIMVGGCSCLRLRIPPATYYAAFTTGWEEVRSLTQLAKPHLLCDFKLWDCNRVRERAQALVIINVVFRYNSWNLTWLHCLSMTSLLAV